MTDLAAHFASLIEPVARELLGEPNAALSSKTELRFGTRGSLTIDVKKGVWYDHETGEGGGLLGLIARETGRQDAERMVWLGEHGYPLPGDAGPARSNGPARPNGPTPHAPDAPPGRGPLVATYDYVDENGELLFQVVRYDQPKDFRQRRRPREDDSPDKISADGWVWKVEGVRRVPYRLPELIGALANEHVVFVVEGEKDADNLWKLGAPASCNPGGAGKWRPEYNEFFEAADVLIISDSDPQAKNPKTGELRFHDDGRPVLPGQDHAQDVARALHPVAARVRVVDLGKVWPSCPEKGDISDWIAAGGTVEQLYEIAEQTRPWAPADQADQGAQQTGQTAKPAAGLIWSSARFVAGFVPPDYVVGGILQRRFCYSFTGRTGAGKTAIMLLLAAHVALGRPFGNREIEKGRVLYFAGENPDDIRARWIALSKEMSFDIDTIDVHFIPGTFKISEMQARIRAEIERIGDFALIMIDTSSAYFEGDNENDNKQAGDHARRLRSLVGMRGGPCVLVACHPPKNAGEDNLQPRGGGAFLAEIDGNLTARKDGSASTEVYWQGKFRGPDFAPFSFQLRPVTHERLKDSKGRSLPTVVAFYLSAGEQEEITKTVRSREDQMLVELAENGRGSQADLARRLDWRMGNGEPYKSMVKRIAQSLIDDKLITYSERDGYGITKKGREKIAPNEPSAAERPKRKSREPEFPLDPMLIEDLGPAPVGSTCSKCSGDADVRVMWDRRKSGKETHPLHAGCAREWFG